ncbi:MAG: alpha/beta fold hydrolase [Ruminococcus sp.]|nr:alpha/beta fold hydrolase [Ruminococcus sp.]
MNECKTKYPLLLVHGMGFRDRKHLNYWGRIPKKLTERGSRVFYGNQDSAGSIEKNAETVAKNLNEALEKSGAEKVNIIAHSKGGLEARYLAANGFGSKIASITTMNTPHNGSLTVDRLMRFPRFLIVFTAKCTDLWMKLLGDKDPDALSCFDMFTTEAAERFSRENPIPDDIYCQSFGFKMKNARSDLLMMIPYLIVKRYDGENDGLLSERAVRWGNYRGMYTSVSGRGISHPDEVDIRRMCFSRKNPSNDHEIADITQFYISVVSELKSLGY